jgi:hypothetical protein
MAISRMTLTMITLKGITVQENDSQQKNYHHNDTQKKKRTRE